MTKMASNVDLIHAVEEIMRNIQDEVDTWLMDNGLTLEFDTLSLEVSVEETLNELMEK